MSQNNTSRSRPTDSSWFARNQPLLLIIVLLVLVAGAFAVGRRTSGEPAPAATSTAEPDTSTNATIPPAITRVPTSTPHAAVPTLEPPTPIPSPTPIILTSGTVLRRIETTKILQTTVFRIDTLVRAQKQGSWFLDWGGEKLLMFVKGSVTAGVDLNELKNIVVSEDERRIIITMPKAKILSATLDSYELQTYDGQKPSQVAPDLLQSGLNAGRQEIAANACESGIIDQANIEAQAAFAQIMHLANFADYQVDVLASQERDCTIDVVLKTQI